MNTVIGLNPEMGLSVYRQLMNKSIENEESGLILAEDIIQKRANVCLIGEIGVCVWSVCVDENDQRYLWIDAIEGKHIVNDNLSASFVRMAQKMCCDRIGCHAKTQAHVRLYQRVGWEVDENDNLWKKVA